MDKYENKKNSLEPDLPVNGSNGTRALTEPTTAFCLFVTPLSLIYINWAKSINNIIWEKALYFLLKYFLPIVQSTSYEHEKKHWFDRLQPTYGFSYALDTLWQSCNKAQDMYYVLILTQHRKSWQSLEQQCWLEEWNSRKFQRLFRLWRFFLESSTKKRSSGHYMKGNSLSLIRKHLETIILEKLVPNL